MAAVAAANALTPNVGAPTTYSNSSTSLAVKHAKVGASTVSRFLRGVQVRPAVAPRVAKAVEALGYHPDELHAPWVWTQPDNWCGSAKSFQRLLQSISAGNGRGSWKTWMCHHPVYSSRPHGAAVQPLAIIAPLPRGWRHHHSNCRYDQQRHPIRSSRHSRRIVR